MDDLEVEAVADLSEGDTPEYILYGGKGGVGKTTMAAATAVASGRADTPTLVVSTDPAHSLSDVFETDITADPTPLLEDAPVWGVEIDPGAAMEDTALFGADGSLALGGLDDLLDSGGDDVGMPGADEAAAVQQLLRFLDDDRFDRVVVDTAPTGHTLRLLELPDALDSLLGRIRMLRDRFADVVPSVGPFGDGEDLDITDTRDRLDRLGSVLRDPDRTDFRLVMVPEDLSVRETTRLRDRLDRVGIPVQTLVVNRVMEPPADVADVPEEDLLAPDLSGCSFCQRRWQVQQSALEDAYELFRDVDVYRVPLLAERVTGRGAIDVVATCLD
ncbi:MAG: ArsA family ATPase [Halobacteriaceae archaeon]